MHRAPYGKAGGTDLRMLAMYQKMRADLRFASREGNFLSTGTLKVCQTQVSHSSTYRTALRPVNFR